MKRVRISVFGAVCLMMFMSSAVVADDPPTDPGGICTLVVNLPLPQPAIDVLQALLGCVCKPPDPCGGGGGD